jgi:hypothetical protein
VQIPVMIGELHTAVIPAGKNAITAKVNPVKSWGLRIILQQFDKKGLPYRSWPGAPPDGKKVNEVIRIAVTQGGKEIPLRIEYDKVIWSGLSWGAGEIGEKALDASMPVEIHCSSAEQVDLELGLRVYAVTYQL